jgi:hypothetical protein
VSGCSVTPFSKGKHYYANNPNTGKILPLICKSANADPKNRIATTYGKFDFFMDNLTKNIYYINDITDENISIIMINIIE